MIRVAIQGVAGSYSEEAARRLSAGAAEIIECLDFESVFDAVRIGTADHAVVPVENKIVGEIHRPAELVRSGGFRILEKLSLRVQHVLAGTPGADFERLTSVRSHVEALKQCRRFLDSHTRIERVIGADTASSVRRIVEDGDPVRAAIGSRRAAEMYGAAILRCDIADDIDNWTTFYLIGN